MAVIGDFLKFLWEKFISISRVALEKTYLVVVFLCQIFGFYGNY